VKPKLSQEVRDFFNDHFLCAPAVMRVRELVAEGHDLDAIFLDALMRVYDYYTDAMMERKGGPEADERNMRELAPMMIAWACIVIDSEDA